MNLEHAMRQVICEMTLLSYGRTQAFASSSGDTEPDSRPPGCSYPLADEWRDKWHRSPCEDTLLMARAELDAWKRSVPVDENDPGWDEEKWIVDDGEGFSAEQVARKFNTTPSRVRGIRVRNGREMDFGLSTTMPHHAPKLQDLVARGLGARQINMLTGVKRSTAQDAINRHRKAA